jgi:LEA14-like dessication related protein
MSNLSILRRTLIALSCILFISILIQCASILQMEKLKNCEFRLERIEGMNIDGIDMSKIHSINDLGIVNASKIITDLSKGALLSEFTIIISVNNPNKSMAAMEKFEYLIMLDDKEVVTGSSNDRVEIPANKSIEFPLSAKTNLSELLKQNSITALMELANTLNKENTIAKRVKIKVKPYIRIGKKLLKYPGFVEIKINEWSK